MSGLLVVVAVPFEARRLARALGTVRADLRIQTVGPGGPGLASLGVALTAFGPAGPAAVLSTGLGGGCSADVRSGDLVVGGLVGPTRTGQWLSPAADMVDRAVRALRAGAVPYHVGPLMTVPEVVATPEAKAACWRSHGALAVDMESAHVLAWAAGRGVPALAVRAIADGPGDTLPRALARVLLPTGAVRLPAALGLLASPALVGSAWRAWRQSRVALRRLAAFVEAFAASREG